MLEQLQGVDPQPTSSHLANPRAPFSPSPSGEQPATMPEALEAPSEPGHSRRARMGAVRELGSSPVSAPAGNYNVGDDEQREAGGRLTGFQSSAPALL